MRLAHLSAPAKAFLLLLASAVVVACLAPLTGEPVEERSALWVVTDRALVRVGLDTDGTHRTTDPIPGAAAAEVRVRGNRLITARADAITSHALTPTLQPGDGTTVAMEAAPVSGFAASAAAERIWLARPVPDSAGDTGEGHEHRSIGPGHGAGPASRIIALDRDLMPQWQRDLPGRVVALASAPADQDDIAVWALQPRQLVGLDKAGATVAGLALSEGPPARAFVPLENRRFAVADVRGVRLFDNAGRLLADQRLIGTRELHAVTADASTGLLWAIGRHRLALLDGQLQPIRTWYLHVQALRRPVAAGTADPRDGSFWFVAGDSLYNAEPDGALTEHRDLFAYLGTDPVTDLALYADIFAPGLTLIEPAEPLVTNNDQPDLVLEYEDTGIGVDPDTLNVERDGEAVDGTCETDTEAQRIECVIGPFDDGTHTITATVADYAGNESEPAEAVFEIDTIAPEITIDSPADGAYVNTEQVTIRGQLSETAELTIDGEVVGLDIDNRFERIITLDSDGTRSIEFEATDGAGNRTARTLTAIRDTVAPPVVAADAVTVEAGEQEGSVRITGADGSVEPDAEIVITNTRTGDQAVVQANADGAFTATIAGEVGDTYEVLVRDAAGNESEPESVTGVDTNIPPDPVDIVPPLPENGVPPFEEQISFLYEGDNAIQQGVAPGTIEARRVSVLRGNVRDRDGNPIPGVTITILRHPELGSTYTQADGDFDMAVNGGGALTVEFRKEGYLPVQRTVPTQWNGWYHADDVVLIPFDDQVTTIDLTDDSQAFQVARGSEVSDADGTRQATVLFPAGTTAEITLPDGSKKQLSQLDIRATEYTIGASGPAAMPGELPPTSGYTYAVELSTDQALEQGVKVQGKDVVFNQPVPFYVENFLDFPTGEPVPVGYYNNDTGNWVPHENGRIIELLTVQGGMAVLDVTGDGNPATTTELDLLGLSEAERIRLAGLYEPGTSLWRFTTTHLSTWDCNWPYGPPADAERPDIPRPEPEEEPDDSSEEDPCDGCVISPQRQSLGESIEIAGTPYSLHYQSDRAAGARSNRVEIPITDSQVPEVLRKVRLDIEIAGRKVTREFPAEPDQTFEFEWDGRDSFGRTLFESKLAQVEVTYVYPCQYYGSVGSASAVGGGTIFGRFGGIANPIGTRDRCQGFEFSTRTVVSLASPAGIGVAAGAGNWSLSVEHRLLSGSGIIERGDGESRKLPTNLIETVAGNLSGGFPLFGGDGGPATEALLNFPEEITVAPDGSLYIADASNNRIRRVSPTKIIDTVAGDGFFGFGGDGGPAVDASLNVPRGVAVAADGSLYIADTANHRLRRVRPDGTIETVAGTGTQGFSGDGGPATQAQLDFPNSVAIGPDGSVYIADNFNHRIRSVSPDGTIDTIAGTGTSGFSGDGALATDAELSFPSGVAVGADGAVYIVDLNNDRIRRVGTDGTIETIAGNGSSGSGGDGGPATDAQLDRPEALAVGADGAVYIAEGFGDRVRRIAPGGIIDTVVGNGVYGVAEDRIPATDASVASPRGVAIGNGGVLYISETSTGRVRVVRNTDLREGGNAEQSVPSRNTDRVFVFDSLGLHRRTVHTHTNETFLAFDRDPEGNLVSITDGDGNITSIERDTSGLATAIVSPDGQRTGITVDDNGHLASLTDPTGSIWSMEYTEDGLLTRIERPGGAVNTFAYDARGRLIEDVDPNGGGWQLARTNLDDGYRVEMVSGEGRSYRFTTERPDDFSRRYRKENPDGTVTERLHTDSDTTIQHPDGTRVVTEELPDPRFGFSGSYVANRQVETPTGLAREETLVREVVLSDHGDPLSLESLAETVTTNGRASTAEYDASLRQWSLTSGEGRTTTIEIDGQNRPLQQVVPGVEAVRTEYDSRGRLSAIEQGVGVGIRRTAFAYHEQGTQGGYLASVTDAQGRSVSFEYDGAGRVTQQTLPDARTIGYQYDGRGNLVALTPPGREAHVFEYDGLDQRLDYTPPDLSGTETVTRYRYNLDRQIREIERPGGEMVMFDYDSGGRLSARRMPAGDTTYGYHVETGQLSSITAPGGVGLQFQWDGFLPIRTDWSGLVSGTVERGFDNNFWLTQETVNGNPIAFAYDKDGLLTDAGTLQLARDTDNGLIIGTTQADIAGSRGYNAFGELADRTVTTGGTGVYDVDYVRDKLGRITQKTETIDGETHTWQYDYDVAGRLEEVRRDGTPVHLYSYDANGNRASHTGPSGTEEGSYDAQDRLTNYGDATYMHTPAGERTSKTTPQGTTSYDYDAAGNLRHVTLPDGTDIEYLIDGQDRRVGKIVNGTLEKGWLYRDQLNPVAQLDVDGNVTHRFVYGDKPNVPAYMIKDGATYRIISDHLGSVRLVIDTDTNEIVQRMDYSPFGKVIVDTSPGFQPFGFAGGLYDRDTGLVRFGARDYDPETGRWTAKDPILFSAGDKNLFGFVLNDPVNWIDIDGLQAGRAPANSGTHPGLRTLPQGFVNVTAGIGGSIAAGIRDAAGIDGGVDPCSDAFQAGQLFGALQRTVGGSAAIFKGARGAIALFTALDVGNSATALVRRPGELTAANAALTAVNVVTTGKIAAGGDTASRAAAAAVNAMSGTVSSVSSQR